MSEEKHNLQKRLEDQVKDQELLRVYKLSQKNIPLAVVLSFFIPVAGYIYTGRWKVFSILFGVTLGLLTVTLSTSRDEESVDRMANFIGVLAAIVAPIDNGIAIQRAKTKYEDL